MGKAEPAYDIFTFRWYWFTIKNKFLFDWSKAFWKREREKRLQNEIKGNEIEENSIQKMLELIGKVKKKTCKIELLSRSFVILKLRKNTGWLYTFQGVLGGDW